MSNFVPTAANSSAALAASPGLATPEKKPLAVGIHGPLSGMNHAARQGQKPAGSFNQWETTNFGNDKANEKFRRLMGIKGGSSAPTANVSETPSSVQKGSAKLFELQEQQYEKARAITHTARGLGLGFTAEPPPAAPPGSASSLPPPPHPPGPASHTSWNQY